MNRDESRRRWQGLIAKQANSEQSVAEFCRRHGISTVSFYQWRKKLKSAAVPEETFVRVNVIGRPAVEIEFPCGAVMRLPGGDRDGFEQVVSLLIRGAGDGQ